MSNKYEDDYNNKMEEMGEEEDRLYEIHIEPNRIREKDKEDKSTQQKVINKKLMMLLMHLSNSGDVTLIGGCISTGKEANVYYAESGIGRKLALKIYKVEVMDYKNRSRYIEGEYRFRKWNYSKNHRKMVQKWAEKEFRNLKRLTEHNIPCPEPLKLCKHLLIMSFLGTSDGNALPKLKDCELVDPAIIFKQIIQLMRKMFQSSKLVHADLSEYNLLYDSNTQLIYIIDVSQAVEYDTIKAIDFLKHDINNIVQYFRKQGLSITGIKEIFDIITTESIQNIDDHLNKIIQGEFNQNDDNVFLNSFIPRNLSQVEFPENDIEQINNGDTSNLLYASLAGMTEQLSIDEDNNSIESIENPINCTSDDIKYKKIKTKEEIKEARKLNKKIVKEEKREKRKEKLPKHLKKQLEKKLTSRNRK